MSGRNNRIVRNRDRTSDFLWNSSIFKIGASILVMILIVIACWLFWKQKNAKRTFCLAEQNDISYEYFILSTENGIGVIDREGNQIIEAKYERN